MKKLLGLLAIGGLFILAAPAQNAQAASLINPGISASTAAQAAGSGVTEVHWRWHRRYYHRHWGWRHRHWGHRHWRHRHW